MTAALPALLLGIATLGFRGSIPERALSSLVAHAQQDDLSQVIGWIEKDPGLMLVPSWQFFYLP